MRSITGSRGGRRQKQKTRQARDRRETGVRKDKAVWGVRVGARQLTVQTDYGILVHTRYYTRWGTRHWLVTRHSTE